VNRFAFNHIGLEQGRAKALLRFTGGSRECEVLTTAGEVPIATLPISEPLASFREARISAVDLSSLPEGRYCLRYEGELSEPFYLESQVLLKRTLSTVLGYFTQQRCEDPWEQQDRSLPFFGNRQGTADVHGGWYDASGDVSKYMSHLSYANFMNPQQTPMVVWGLLSHLERRSEHHEAGMRARLSAEAKHGADFLCRMQDEEGYFYMTVFDQWKKDLDRRVICTFKKQTGELLEGYQCGYRQGGGVAIAALARSAVALSEPRYLEAARRGYEHLEEHNLLYLDDGKENVIDDYCALLAATELLAATGEEAYRDGARFRAARLMDRIQTTGGPCPGWLRADDKNRPFYHAAEAGLPVLALLRLADIDVDNASIYESAAERVLQFELGITSEVDNPYGYGRQYVQDAKGETRSSFFIPHENETGYWWQGENARLASLAAAAAAVAHRNKNATFREELLTYAVSQLDWICGKNPFDACMIHGFGRNNGNYMDKWPNVLGGICNGITAGFEDESDVDFGRADVKGDQSWRWHEQWLPHATWFVVALSELSPAPRT